MTYSDILSYIATMAQTDPLKKPMSLRNCQRCGIEQNDGYKYCRNCAALLKSARWIKDAKRIAYKESHRRAARKYQMANKEAELARRILITHLKFVKILYECPCRNGNKSFHHFDYDRPLEALLLCPNCHRAEHERIRLLADSTSGKS
jgi:hypothetical protein